MVCHANYMYMFSIKHVLIMLLKIVAECNHVSAEYCCTKKLEKVLCTEDIYPVYKRVVENIIYAVSIIYTTMKKEHFLTVRSSHVGCVLEL